MTETRGLLDKSDWGPGPWQDEPDRVEWKAHGFHCLITRSDLSGSLCGYVALPEGHPWFEKGYDQIEADAHGGVNYVGHCQGKICHVPPPGEPDHVWWIGFDCGHGGDVQPAMDAHMRALVGDRWKPMHEMFGGFGGYRDLAYVRAEVEGLAEQASRA